MRKLRLPFLSTRKSTLPPLMSLTALVTSMVTVPVFGFGMRPRGPSTRPEAADLAHHVRSGDDGVEVEEAARRPSAIEVVVTDDVGASLESFGGLRATGEDEDLGGLTGAVRQVHGTADQLVGLARIHVQAQHGLNGLVELVLRHALEESDGFVGGVKVVAIDLLSRFAILLGTLYHLVLLLISR